MAVKIGRLSLEVKLSGWYEVIDAQGEKALKQVRHSYKKDFINGANGDDKMDVVWEDSDRTLAAADFDADLVGGLTAADGNPIAAFAELGLLWAENKSVSADNKLTLGNGGANAVNGDKAGFGSDTDTMAIGPQGLLLVVSPNDGQGIQLTAGSGDILKLSPGAGTFAVKLFLAGRSI